MFREGEKSGMAKDENGLKKQARNLSENVNRGGDMPDLIAFPPDNIPLDGIISLLTKAQREKLISGFDLKNLARIFEDEDTMSTVESFFSCSMNVSETSRRLYMHRNTLIYRLNKIENVTGLDIRRFDMAVTFKILHILYTLK